MSGKRLTVCSDSIGEGAERRGHRIRDGAGVMGLQSSDDSGSGDHSGIYSTYLYHSSANPTDHQAANALVLAGGNERDNGSHGITD